MINFIPLKQSEEFLPNMELFTNKGQDKKGINFKDVFGSVSAKATLGKNIIQSKTNEVGESQKKINNEISNKKETALSVKSEKITSDEINQKIEAILEDEEITEEELKNIVAMLMSFIEQQKNSHLDPTTQTTDEFKNIKMKIEFTFNTERMDRKQLKQLLVDIKETLTNNMSKTKSDLFKLELFDKIVDKLDSGDVKFTVQNNVSEEFLKFKTFKDTLDVGKDGKVELKDLSSEIASDNELILISKVENEGDTDTEQQFTNNNFDKQVEMVGKQSVNTEKVDVKHIEIKDVKDIIKIVDTIEMAKSQGVKKLTVQLHPENLGKLEIQLVETGGKINAKIFTDNEQARFLLANNLEQMRNQLQSKGIHIDNMEFSFMMANEDKGKQPEKEGKGGFKFGGAVIEDEVENKQVNGLYA